MFQKQINISRFLDYYFWIFFLFFLLLGGFDSFGSIWRKTWEEQKNSFVQKESENWKNICAEGERMKGKN